jgi:hypothetical protein
MMRRWWVSVGVVVAAASAGAAGAATASATAGVPAVALGKPQVIGAPHYGDTLFNFYQDKTYDALVGLMVSQHFARINPHDDEAEVLRGGMLLAFGMHQEATGLFSRLINNTTSPAVRDRAWYFLARAKQQRGLFDEAQEALSKINAPLQGPAVGDSSSNLEQSRQLLQAQVMLAREDYAGAAAVLQALKDNNKVGAGVGLIARFNLGVALIKNGELEQGQVLLEAVGQTPAANEEQRSVRDRANLALGLAALQAEQPSQARVALQRVRLSGLESNRALLGFGWAAMGLNEPQLALVPWQELATRPVDPAVWEARLAVPYALAEIGATQRSLQAYEQAADAFVQEQRNLAESIRAIRAGTLVKDMVAQNPSEGLGSFASIQTLPSMPHATHLAPLLASNDFQQAFKNLYDLRFLQNKLLQWQDNLASFAQMMDNRRVAFEQRLPAVRAKSGADNNSPFTANLQKRSEALAAELAQAKANNDATVFADPREAALLQRLARAQTRLAGINAESTAPAVGDAADRLRLLSGALTWQLTQALPERSWQATKGLRATDDALVQARTREAALAAAQANEPARQQAFGSRIASLTQRLASLLPALTQAQMAQQQQLVALAVAELQNQQERLTVYEGQARLARAQLEDQAQFTRPREDGTPADSQKVPP